MLDTSLLGFILSIDASLVAFSYGLAMKKWNPISALKLASITSLFQFLMPLFGYFLLQSMSFWSDYAKQFDHWIVCIIFMFLGWKIIKDAFTQNKEEVAPLSFLTLFAIGVATSIDALAGGAMIFAQNISIWTSALHIAVIAFVLVYTSYICSRFFMRFPHYWINLIGGGLLIFLGFKIFFEHTIILEEGFRPW